jgi:hypothetical protein
MTGGVVHESPQDAIGSEKGEPGSAFEMFLMLRNLGTPWTEQR